MPQLRAVHVSGRLLSDVMKRRQVPIEFAIRDTSGHVLASTSLESTATLEPTVSHADLRLAHPRLWQRTKDPYLYRTVMTIRAATSTVLDEVSQPLGIRTMDFDPNRGFFLNGEHLMLKGASMHQDRPIKGWAISRADQEQDFDLLQALGGNAVRLAHYQHDQYSYDLTDARGIVAWAEIPLVN